MRAHFQAPCGLSVWQFGSGIRFLNCSIKVCECLLHGDGVCWGAAFILHMILRGALVEL